MDLAKRLGELSVLRGRWSPPASSERAKRRRHHAAWCNAGIEGNPLSWPRAEELLASAEAEGCSRAEKELLGCARALAYIDCSDEPLSLPLLRHLHVLLMDGIAPDVGQLRRREVRIMRESGPDAGQTVFAPPHSARISELLEELLAGIDENEDPFLASGRFHYEFQSIHPFGDGNGRLGRLISTLLARRGWDSASFYLSPAVSRAGAGYYLALRAVRPDHRSEARQGLAPWLQPFFDIVEDALRNPDPEGKPESEESPDVPFSS